MKTLIISLLLSSFTFAQGRCEVIDEVLSQRDRLLQYDEFSIDRDSGMALSKKMKIASVSSVILSMGLIANNSLYKQAFDAEFLAKINAKQYGLAYKAPAKVSFISNPVSYFHRAIGKRFNGKALFITAGIATYVTFLLDEKIDEVSIVRERDPLSVLLIEDRSDRNRACDLLLSSSKFKLALEDINSSLEDILNSMEDHQMRERLDIISTIRDDVSKKKAKNFYELHQLREVIRE